MSLDGSLTGLLHQRHARGCNGTEYSSVETAPFGDGFAVIYTAWCGDCGAADYALVDTFANLEDQR